MKAPVKAPLNPVTRAKLRVNVDLQDDFSMDQALSLYLLETIPVLDPESETHALDLLTLVESILENPELVLRRQLDKLKGEAVARMKAEGLDYDQRMEQLEKLEHPKPLRDFVYGTFNAFADRHPWVGEENIRPKSIAREMFEGFRSFSDYVQEYDLERAEGLLLRHLNSVYKVLGQTVPDGAKTDTVREMELYLRDMLRGVDSSLLDEWERMRDPNYRPLGTAGADLRPPRPEEPPDVTRDAKAFTAAIRTRLFVFLRAWSIGNDEAALEAIDSPADARRAAVDGGAAEGRARGLPRRARRPAARPRGAQPPPHPRAALRRPRELAGPADARGPGGPQRLGAGARRGPRRLPGAGRAGAEAPAARRLLLSKGCCAAPLRPGESGDGRQAGRAPEVVGEGVGGLRLLLDRVALGGQAGEVRGVLARHRVARALEQGDRPPDEAEAALVVLAARGRRENLRHSGLQGPLGGDQAPRSRSCCPTASGRGWSGPVPGDPVRP